MVEVTKYNRINVNARLTKVQQRIYSVGLK